MQARQNPVIAFWASLKLTTVCLFLLAVLVLWGTLDQVDQGLYLAQQRFFNSWFVPGLWVLPGARLVIWILFINLVTVLLTRFRYSWSNFGLILSHTGMIVLILSAFVSFHFSSESFMQLREAEQSNQASDYILWELAVWQDDKKFTIREKELSVGKFFEVDGLKVYVKDKFLNARYFDTPFAGRIFKPLEIEKDFEKNNRAITLILDNRELTLVGEQEPSAFVTINDKQYIFELRRKAYKLPFAIQLLDVERDLHPGTQVAKSYRSKVKIIDKDAKRKFSISMNKPYRSGNYTVYQSSYGQDLDGNEFTVLAVVKNYGRLLPYISSLIISIGLFWHFGQALLKYLRSKNA